MPPSSGSGGRTDDGKLVVIVSVAPQSGLLQRIGGERLSISVLVPVGKEPENFQSSPDTVAKLAKGRLFCRVGFAFEEPLLKKLESIAPQLQIVDFREGITMRKLELHSHAHHDHEHGHDHAPHGEGSCADLHGQDVHTWMSIRNLKIQAKSVFEALVRLDPEHETEYRENYKACLAELDAEGDTIVATLKPFHGETLFVFHPAYGYFCEEFGLAQQAIEFEGRSPKPKELAAWIQSLGHETKPIIFIQPEFNRSAADAIVEATGGTLVVHSPLQNDPLQSIRELAASYVKAHTNP